LNKSGFLDNSIYQYQSLLISKHFRKTIIFCTNPLLGCFRFDDYFQIYPWTSEYAPISDKAKLFPMALEYFFDDAEEMPVPKELEELKAFISRETHSNPKQRRFYI